jgi:hypothetical protein
MGGGAIIMGGGAIIMGGGAIIMGPEFAIIDMSVLFVLVYIYPPDILVSALPI